MRRILAALGVIVVLAAGPAAGGRLDALALRNAGSVEVGATAAKWAALSSRDRRTPAGIELGALLRRESAVVQREEGWNRRVASVVGARLRAEGLALADLDAPAPRPPASAPAADGDTVALLDTLVRRYGVDPDAVLPDPTEDEWPSVDRRTRTRALLALARADRLDATSAGVIVAATLDLLDAWEERSRGAARMQVLAKGLFPED